MSNQALWQFVQISDPHLGSVRDGEWNNRFLCTMMPGVMACLGRDLARLHPDFLLVTGDIVSKQSHKAMGEARDSLDALGVPYYPMGGNHDFVLQDSRAWFIDVYANRLPARNTVYTFIHKGIRFCVLDAWWRWPDGALLPVAPQKARETMEDDLKGLYWALPPEQLTWLNAVLTANPNEPTLLAVHFPAIPIPDRLRRFGLKDGGSLDNGHLLLQMLDQHPQVAAIFSGHVHMHFIESAGGVVQVATGALPEYPTEYRLVSVFEDRLEITTRGLSDPSFAARSLIPGREYTSGSPQDRTATIPLRRKRVDSA